MKTSWILGFAIFFLVIVCSFCSAEEAAVVVAVEGASIWDAIFGFLNSPVGVTAVSGLIAWLLSRLWTAKPAWKLYYDQYQGVLIQAVKFAEKQIPDNVENKGLLRLDMALKYVLKLQPSLEEKALKQALTVVHADAESKENI